MSSPGSIWAKPSTRSAHSWRNGCSPSAEDVKPGPTDNRTSPGCGSSHRSRASSHAEGIAPSALLGSAHARWSCSESLHVRGARPPSAELLTGIRLTRGNSARALTRRRPPNHRDPLRLSGRIRQVPLDCPAAVLLDPGLGRDQPLPDGTCRPRGGLRTCLRIWPGNHKDRRARKQRPLGGAGEAVTSPGRRRYWPLGPGSDSDRWPA